MIAKYGFSQLCKRSFRARQPKDINMIAKYGCGQLCKRSFRARQPKDINMIAKYASVNYVKGPSEQDNRKI